MDGLSVLRGVRDERNDRGRCPHVLLGRLWSLRRDGRLLGCVHRGSPRCPAIYQELQKRIYLWNEVYILSLYRVSGFGQVVPGFLWRWRIFYLWLFRRKVKPSGSIEKQYLIFSDTQIRRQLPWGICNGFPFFLQHTNGVDVDMRWRFQNRVLCTPKNSSPVRDLRCLTDLNWYRHSGANLRLSRKHSAEEEIRNAIELVKGLGFSPVLFLSFFCDVKLKSWGRKEKKWKEVASSARREIRFSPFPNEKIAPYGSLK